MTCKYHAVPCKHECKMNRLIRARRFERRPRITKKHGHEKHKNKNKNKKKERQLIVRARKRAGWRVP